MNSPALDLSVVLIVKNEAHRIERCLQSLPQGAEICILDSFSEDNTFQICQTIPGTIVQQRAFDDYSSQRNAAAQMATRSWILYLDADEVLSDELKTSLEDTFTSTQNQKQCEGKFFRVQRRLMFAGRMLRFGKSVEHPSRLCQNQAAIYQGSIHEELVPVKGQKILLWDHGFIYHYSYVSLADFVAKLQTYAQKVAEVYFSAGRKASVTSVILRPCWEFVMRYILRGGFMDGYPGFLFAAVFSYYSFCKWAQVKELADQSQSK